MKKLFFILALIALSLFAWERRMKITTAVREGGSRCGSVTLAGKQRTVLFSDTLAPLRYPSPTKIRFFVFANLSF